jgi:tRNA methyl transferase
MVRIVQGQIRTLLKKDTKNTHSTTTISPIISTTTISSCSATQKPTVAILLSGGVSLSVALLVIKSQGYAVTVLYLKIWFKDELAHLGHCPWKEAYNLCMEICLQANVLFLKVCPCTRNTRKEVISYTVAKA